GVLGRLRRASSWAWVIRLCLVEEGFGWHIVFETPEGLATLILVPGKQLRGLQTASSGGWNALVRPARGGYYAIVTGSAAFTSRADRLLRERVDWTRSRAFGPTKTGGKP
ncbi:MAG: hypothetical protein ACREUO_10545, partial [Burkholderiales bacterium]